MLTNLLTTPIWSFVIAAALIAGFGAVTTLLLQLAWNRTETAQARDAHSRRLLGALDDGPPWLLFLDYEGRLLQANRAFADAFPTIKTAPGTSANTVLTNCGADPSLLVRLDAARHAGQGFRLPLLAAQYSQNWLLIGQPWKALDSTSGYWLLGVEMTSELTESARLERLAYRDLATGLPNRQWLYDQVEQHLAEKPKTVLQITFPRFANLVTTLGREQAELTLAGLAARLTGSLTRTQAIARVDGASFALIDTKWLNEYAVQTIADLLAEPYVMGGHEIRLLPAIGIEYPIDGTLDSWLADAALAATSLHLRHRGAVVIYNAALRDHQQRAQTLIADLRRAIYFAPEQITAAYQPICRLADGKLVGAELLARWEHPLYGTIKPRDFIPLAESTGLIGALWVQLFAAGCRQLAHWQQANPDFFLSVNLSGRQLENGSLLKTTDIITELTGIAPAAIKLELTETGLMDDVESAIGQLQALKARGYRLSVDDFGTSFTNLAELHRLPLTDVKIDRAFVNGMHAGAAGRELVAMMARLGNALGHTVTAEGIETTADLQLLCQDGCSLGQGHHFGRAINAQAFTLLLGQSIAALETV